MVIGYHFSLKFDQRYWKMNLPRSTIAQIIIYFIYPSRLCTTAVILQFNTTKSFEIAYYPMQSLRCGRGSAYKVLLNKLSDLPNSIVLAAKSLSQHEYRAGLSTKTILHRAIPLIQTQLNSNGFVMGTLRGPSITHRHQSCSE